MANDNNSEEKIKSIENNYRKLHAVEFDPLNILLPPFVKEKMTEYKGQKIFTLSNPITISPRDSADYNKSIVLNKDTWQDKNKKSDYQKKILSFHEQISFGLTILIVSILILFGTRYLFYIVRWSLNTLKQKIN